MTDAKLSAKLRAEGLCAEIGPPPEPGAKPYMCSLNLGHDGAHVAKIAQVVVDTWSGS